MDNAATYHRDSLGVRHRGCCCGFGYDDTCGMGRRDRSGFRLKHITKHAFGISWLCGLDDPRLALQHCAHFQTCNGIGLLEVGGVGQGALDGHEAGSGRDGG